MARTIVDFIVAAAIAAATAVAILAVAQSRAEALPCLGKLERGADHYRLVNGHRCWYAGDEVPDKSEFKVKRKEVVRHGSGRSSAHSARPAVATELAPPRADPLASMDDEAWLRLERPLEIDAALCGGPCPDFRARRPAKTAAAVVEDAFADLAPATYRSFPVTELRGTVVASLWAKED